MNIAQGILPFQLIEDSSKVLMTSFSGLPLVMETFRALGLPQSIEKYLPLHKRPGQYEEADYVESFISAFAAGGDCFDNFQLLRQDPGLQKLGLKVPSPESARFFVNAFHEEEKLQGRIPHEAFIPEETERLQGLEKIHQDLIRKATLRTPPWKATIDIDASVIESDKRKALYTYLGCRGYQPVIAYWAEQDLVVVDQFRDGNVPAGTGLKVVLQKALRALPPTVRLVRLRSDSAAYVHELLDWCREEIPGRPRIEFAISADMTKELRAVIQKLPEEAWKPLRKVVEKG